VVAASKSGFDFAGSFGLGSREGITGPPDDLGLRPKGREVGSKVHAGLRQIQPPL